MYTSMQCPQQDNEQSPVYYIDMQLQLNQHKIEEKPGQDRIQNIGGEKKASCSSTYFMYSKISPSRDWLKRILK